MPQIVFSIAVFVGLGVFFLFIHLLMGRFIRPVVPEDDKLTIYECGEPTIGSAWIQFDLRYYVVALLFVIFDVEVAFFFPWATVFGKANDLAQANITQEQRLALTKELVPANIPPVSGEESAARAAVLRDGIDRDAARRLAWVGFFDILVFFGVLLMGFAYLWKRGDINWVRSLSGEKIAEDAMPPPQSAHKEILVGSEH